MTEGECFFILSFRRTLCATFPTGEGFLGFPLGGSSACGDEGQTNKTLAFCQKRTSTFFDRKMRSRRRPWLRLTQAACQRVSSSCTLYEVFGNFAWRSAPPRKRVASLGKAPDCETESVPAQRGFPWIPCCIAIRGTETGGNSVRKGG